MVAAQGSTPGKRVKGPDLFPPASATNPNGTVFPFPFGDLFKGRPQSELVTLSKAYRETLWF